MSEATVKTLVQKLAEACNAVGGVEKKGRNAAQGYDYVKAADIAKAIRHELFKRGIVVIPNEVECSTKQIEFTNAKGETRRSNEVVVRTAYEIRDGVDCLVFHGYGIAWDAGDKAIYKAKTGALKYFLRGLGLIPDEKDDPEADESVDLAVSGRTAMPKPPVRSAKLTTLPLKPANGEDSFAKNFWAAAKKTGKTEQTVRNYLGSIGCEHTAEIKPSQYNECMTWAEGE